MALLERYPILVFLGAALLGWVAGDIMIKDAALLDWTAPATVEGLHYWAAAMGAVSVVGAGLLIRRVRHKDPLHLSL
jgi:predicted tellurium resistance membrane protein TerC